LRNVASQRSYKAQIEKFFPRSNRGREKTVGVRVAGNKEGQGRKKEVPDAAGPGDYPSKVDVEKGSQKGKRGRVSQISCF